MHNSITFGLTSIACLTVAACNSQQKTESIPATPLVEPTPIVAETTPITAPKLLAIGDDAPEISVNKWVKGGAIDGFEEGQVYVMEFWATWCPPCLASIPHLTEIQEQYADDNVNVIGCAIWQREDTQDARETKVSTFVDDQGDKMSYTVAVDNESWMSDNWMKPAGRNGIPSAFIIDGTGTVAWIGSPFSMDEPLEQIVNGTWDVAAAADVFRKEQAQQNAMREFQISLSKAEIEEDWDTYITAIDEYIAEYGDNPRLQEMKFNALLTGKEDKAGAYALAGTIVEADWDDSNALNSFAWEIVDETPAEYQDLNFALRVANRACELTDYKNSMILDTLARCYWEMGDRYKAIAWQEKAVANADAGQTGDSIQATLEEYQATLANVDE